MSTLYLRIGFIICCSLSALTSLSGAPKRVTGLSWGEAAVLSQSSDSIWFGHADGSVSRVDAESGRLLQRWPQTGNNQIEQISLSADGKRALTVSPNRVLRVLSAESTEPEEIMGWSLPEYGPGGAISPDGAHVLVVAYGSPVRWSDVKTGQILREWSDSEAGRQGYAFAVVLNNEGLAVVAPPEGGEAALIDAAKGEVLARLTGGRGRLDWLTPTESLAWGSVTWSRAELLGAAVNRPPVALTGHRNEAAAGRIGLAVRKALPPEEWTFWCKTKQGELNQPAWMEPSWPQLRQTDRPNGIRSAIVVDRTHQTIWWHEEGDTWIVWPLHDLGKPDALAMAGYPNQLSVAQNSLLLASNGNDYLAYVDPEEMQPVATFSGEPLRVNTVETKDRLIDRHWTPEGGWIEGIFQRTADLRARIHWANAHGAAMPEWQLGMPDQPPRLARGPGDLIAVIFPQRQIEPLGATHISRSTLQLWNAVTNDRMAERFDDHRSTSVGAVRWSLDGKFLTTSDGTGINSPKTIRLWSVPDGRRIGKPVPDVAGWSINNSGALAWTNDNGQVYVRAADGSASRQILPPNELLRSARIALSPDGTHLAFLTGRNELVVIAVSDGREIYRQALSSASKTHWESPSGDVLYSSEKTVAVLSSREGWLRVIRYPEPTGDPTSSKDSPNTSH